MRFQKAHPLFGSSDSAQVGRLVGSHALLGQWDAAAAQVNGGGGSEAAAATAAAASDVRQPAWERWIQLSLSLVRSAAVATCASLPRSLLPRRICRFCAHAGHSKMW